MRRSITWQGALAGALGGFIGSWVMDEFQLVWSAAEKRLSKDDARKSVGEPSTDSEPAPVKVVVATKKAVLAREATESDKKIGSQIVHYGFGTAMGLLYGALADKTPKTHLGGATVFAASLWLGTDEMALPVLKLSPGPRESPLSKHIYGLASHLVYGLTLEGVRRGVLAAIK